MSLLLINQYYNELDRIQRFSGSKNEDTIKGAFANLVNGLARPRNLELVREVQIQSRLGTPVRPDGILRSILQLDYGYWESKDTKDDLFTEIEAKFNKGYPQNNILFEDSQTAILYQENCQFQVKMTDSDKLLELLHTFINYERPEVVEFNKAIGQFRQDLPNILESLRQLIEQEGIHNAIFIEKRNLFLKLCQNSINPHLDLLDMREMLIQHILTEEIFLSIFNNADYHRENNIAQSLYEVEKTFFRGQTKQNLLAEIRPYYNLIKARANEMISHAEKQKFLKIIYENFYKSYNPKAADRLGIVYTPNEIVDFMIAGTDFLLERHFSKTLGSKNVEILDPCTGTGTFITQLIEHIPSQQLEYKYQNEIHANEMALLPYYVANLNIEAVYQQKMNCFQEFNNLCFVDTLDNTQALYHAGKQNDMFGTMSLENVARIKRQNEKTISVIIGNPPYNAKQENYNFQNANRVYVDIDKRIKETYIKQGTAQNQIVVYDMYTRFYRWATDRLNQNGILAFVTNRSFIDSRAFDGFRRELIENFQEIWILDTKSDVRMNPKIAGTTHNVFGIQTGVCITFLVKNAESGKKCKIFYFSLKDEQRKEEKLDFLRDNPLSKIPFERIMPDDKGNWINQTDNDFDGLIPLIDKEVKAGKSQQAVFQLFSLGVQTTRDEWVYDFSINFLTEKTKFFIEAYNSSVSNNCMDFSIKWSSSLESYFYAKSIVRYEQNLIKKSLYRPFVKKYHYLDRKLNHRLTENHYSFFGINLNNQNNILAISGVGSNKPFHCLCSLNLIGLDTLEKTQCLPLYRYENGEKIENITDWALKLFRGRYCLNQDSQDFQNKVSLPSEGLENSDSDKLNSQNKIAQHPENPINSENPDSDRKIEKLDIFHYVYAVLHNPAYRQKYAQNLKRDFPRIPFYDDFWQWSNWGNQLMKLHIDYENITPYSLKRVDKPLKNPEAKAKPKLRADKVDNKIEVDEITTLSGIPTAAWEYKLGNRSALEWILDQYKEKKPSDPTILEKFNNYRFADYKEQMIDLLQKVCTVSVETVGIVAKMSD